MTRSEYRKQRKLIRSNAKSQIKNNIKVSVTDTDYGWEKANLKSAKEKAKQEKKMLKENK